ncbi:hypothetical protein BC628DRAFT_1316876 [Trametes gibbosa]|nr:hypothetical protein BC628DRAFT_1327315 [Trametes gibbosa]KAI0828186.1 hypothetical protein BC628DRAFT_1316876 [Trametes gibbosa]
MAAAAASHIPVAVPIALTATGRQRAGPQDPLKHAGRHFARTVDMFVLPAVVVNAGIKFDPSRSPLEYSPEEQRNHKSWDALLRIVPNLMAMLADPAVQNPISAIMSVLLAGSNAARADDTRLIKIAVVEWLADDLKAAGVTLNPKTKLQRGFNNKVTGRLLCPVVLDYDDPRFSHQAMINGELVNGSDWPKFVFDQQGFNPAQPWVNFLRSRLIILAFRHVFLSPSSALSNNDLEGARGTRTGNAALHGMMSVTPGSIIYAATHVHFALSSAAVFNKNNQNNNTVVFHNALIAFFEDPLFAAPIADLLMWWNRYVPFKVRHDFALLAGSSALQCSLSHRTSRTRNWRRQPWAHPDASSYASGHAAG